MFVRRRAQPPRPSSDWLLCVALASACTSPADGPAIVQRGPAQALWTSASTPLDNGDTNYQPVIAADGAGNYLVAFAADTCQDGCDEIRAALVETDPSSGIWSTPGAVRVQNIRNGPARIGVATSDGVYLVVWDEVSFDKSGRRDRIMGATMTANGGNVVSSGSFLISDDVGDSRAPAVAGMPGGRWLVVWEDDEDSGQGTSIHGRMVVSGSLDLIPAEDDVLLTDDGATGRTEQTPALAWDGARFLLTFDDDRGGGDIYGAMIDVTTTATPSATPTFAISHDATDALQRASSVACRSGACLVAWEDARNAGDADIYGARVTAGVPDATDVGLAVGMSAQDVPIVVASIGSDLASSSYLLAYSDELMGPTGAWLDATSIQPIAPLRALDASLLSAVASSGAGQFLLAAEIDSANTFVDVAFSYLLALPNGAACPTSLPQDGEPSPAIPDDGCLSSTCVLGLCCNTTCDGACATCDGVGSTTPPGTCGARASGSALCRAGSPDGVCDPAESCDGVSLDCPTDVVRTSTFTCRPAAAEPTCDAPDQCTGVALDDCPADGFKSLGDTCRAGSGDMCNPSETCSGTSAACPADQLLADGDPCDVDVLVCNGRPVCAAGMCVDPGAPSCDDGDPCTTDTCAEPTGCAHAPIAGCGVDAGLPDARPADSGPRPDGGAVADVGPETTTEGNGCTCQSTDAGSSGAWAFVLLGLCGWVVLRRRPR